MAINNSSYIRKYSSWCIDDNTKRFLSHLRTGDSSDNDRIHESFLESLKKILLSERWYLIRCWEDRTQEDRDAQFQDVECIISMMGDPSFFQKAQSFNIRPRVVSRIIWLVNLWRSYPYKKTIDYHDVFHDLVDLLMAHDCFGEWVRRNKEASRDDKEFRQIIVEPKPKKEPPFYSTRFGIFHESGECIDFFRDWNFLVKWAHWFEIQEDVLWNRKIYKVSYLLGISHSMRIRLLYTDTHRAVFAYWNNWNTQYRIKALNLQNKTCLCAAIVSSISKWGMILDLDANTWWYTYTWRLYSLGEDDRIIIDDQV